MSFQRVKLQPIVLLLLVAAAAIGLTKAQDYVDECPEPNGLYADAVQCDRYYECKDGQISDKLCPDGLVFDESSTVYAKCSFPFSVNCTDRPELQPAKRSRLCPRLNGYFTHEDPEVCDKFYFCVDGVENKISCPESLIFNPKTGQCAYSDQIDRPGCSSTDFFKFSCPNNPNSRHAHPRYPDPLDCQYFYLCLNGKEARRNGCQTGFVFNQVTSSCEHQDKLEEGDRCRTWYNQTVLDELRGPGGSAIIPLNQGGKKTGTGIALDTKNRKRVQVVRRKRPRPQGQGQGQLRPQVSSLPDTPRRVPGGSRVAINSGLRAAQDQLQQQQVAQGGGQPVRTRVRRPPLPGFVEEAEQTTTPRGPPQFALSDAAAIQRFRDQNRLVPENAAGGSGSGNGGRLTVLSGNTAPRRQLAADSRRPVAIQEENQEAVAAPRPTPFTVFNRNRGAPNRAALPRRRPQQQQQQPEQVLPEEPEQEFTGQTQETDFGSRFRSRRPQPTSSRLPDSDQIRQLPIRRNPDQQTRSRGALPSRGRLEVSPINVQPQFDLGAGGRGQERQQQQDFQDSPSFSSFPSFDSARQY